ncbi:hypothetical protein [Bradyrhizobium sp.]
MAKPSIGIGRSAGHLSNWCLSILWMAALCWICLKICTSQRSRQHHD